MAASISGTTPATSTWCRTEYTRRLNSAYGRLVREVVAEGWRRATCYHLATAWALWLLHGAPQAAEALRSRMLGLGCPDPLEAHKRVVDGTDYPGACISQLAKSPSDVDAEAPE